MSLELEGSVSLELEGSVTLTQYYPRPTLFSNACGHALMHMKSPLSSFTDVQPSESGEIGCKFPSENLEVFGELTVFGEC